MDEAAECRSGTYANMVRSSSTDERASIPNQTVGNDIVWDGISLVKIEIDMRIKHKRYKW